MYCRGAALFHRAQLYKRLKRLFLRAIILFDGVCNLCNGFVRFVIKRDHHDVFMFGPLQSEKAKQILRQSGYEAHDSGTVVLLYGDRIVTESDAVLMIVKQLRRPWSLLFIFFIVPKFIRDAVYRFVARNRYKLFGQRESCMVPTEDIKDKFI